MENQIQIDLKKLSKEELIKIIDSYKQKVADMEEYERVMGVNSM